MENYDVVSFDAFTFRKFEFPLSWYKKLGFEEIKEWLMISGNVKKVLLKLAGESSEHGE